MKGKKTIAILVLAVTSLAVFQSLGKAQELPITPTSDPNANAAMIAEKIQSGALSQPALPPDPFRDFVRKPVVDVVKGVAFDKTTMKEEAVVLLRINAAEGDTIYLLKGSEIMKLEIKETKSLGNFWFVRLLTGIENVDLLVQEAGSAYISGTFRNYILSFEPYYVYYGCYDRYCVAGSAEGQTSVAESSSSFWR